MDPNLQIGFNSKNFGVNHRLIGLKRVSGKLKVSPDHVRWGGDYRKITANACLMVNQFSKVQNSLDFYQTLILRIH